MSNIFSTIETLSVPRSKQKMSFREITTYNFGKLYPCFAMDCVPSDTVKINMASIVKALPMVAPNMTPDKMTVHFWFVPYRLLDENFADGVKGFKTNSVTHQKESYSYNFPKWVNPHNGDSSDNLVGTLWDYFGLGINVKVVSGVLQEDATYVDGVEPTSYLKRAYNLVFNTMYRNQNTTSEVSLDSDDIQFRCWRADYFTKSLPSQQSPVDLDSVFGLPIEFVGPDHYFPVDIYTESSNGKFTYKFSDSYIRQNYHTSTPSNSVGKPYHLERVSGQEWKNALGSDSAGSYKTFIGDKHDSGTSWTPTSAGVYNDTSGNDDPRFGFNPKSMTGVKLSSFDQSDFRLWMQLQKWAERNNRSGSERYDEYIASHFGIKPQDARLQLPEFLGGVKTTIAVADEFASANSLNAQSQVVPQGTRTGVAGAGIVDQIKPYHVQEFGVIIGIASILPQAEYMQGIERQWIKHDSMDFFRHEFCCLSDREVYDGELCLSNGKYVSGDNATSDLTSDERKAFNTGVFGFQGMYDEMRFFKNKITGQMRTLFAHWHQARNFDATAGTDKKTQVKLNANFVEARDVALRPFVDQTGNDVFMVKHLFKVIAYRPCTQKAIPGLSDHF